MTRALGATIVWVCVCVTRDCPRVCVYMNVCVCTRVHGVIYTCVCWSFAGERLVGSIDKMESSSSIDGDEFLDSCGWINAGAWILFKVECACLIFADTIRSRSLCRQAHENLWAASARSGSNGI